MNMLINNGKGTEWSPIWSVIIRVINKIYFPIFLIMITDQIGGLEVLLPINHNYNKFCDNLNFFKVAKHSLIGWGSLPFTEILLKTPCWYQAPFGANDSYL